MKLDDRLAMACTDAEHRGLPELVPQLTILARAINDGTAPHCHSIRVIATRIECQPDRRVRIR